MRVFEMKVKYRIFIFRVSRLGNDVPMSFNVSVFSITLKWLMEWKAERCMTQDFEKKFSQEWLTKDGYSVWSIFHIL